MTSEIDRPRRLRRFLIHCTVSYLTTTYALTTRLKWAVRNRLMRNTYVPTFLASLALKRSLCRSSLFKRRGDLTLISIESGKESLLHPRSNDCEERVYHLFLLGVESYATEFEDVGYTLPGKYPETHPHSYRCDILRFLTSSIEFHLTIGYHLQPQKQSFQYSSHFPISHAL